MIIRGATALVTGASGAIGSGTVRALAAEGANVVLCAPASEAEALEALASKARGAGVEAIVEPVDVMRREDIDRVVARATQAFGGVDILANIAGIGSRPSLCDSSDADIERVIGINLTGCARTMHAVLPGMKERRRGSIVNIGSVAGEAAVLGLYSASKFGLRGLNDSVRREVRSYGISVTLIEPGFVESPMNAAMDGLPSPEIVARAVIRAIRRPRRRVIVPKRYYLPVLLVKALPALVDAVFGDARIQDRLNRDARDAERSGS